MQRSELVPIEPGWIVRLITGGPRMVVNETHWDHDDVECVWFDEHFEAHRIVVNFNTLVVLDSQPGVTIFVTE